jgi:hypothetical protein
MNNLPNEIILHILNYTYNCDKNRNYIVDKTFYKIHKNKCKDCELVELINKKLCIHKNKCKDCELVELINKKLCYKCEKPMVIRQRLIMNNLLPG